MDALQVVELETVRTVPAAIRTGPAGGHGRAVVAGWLGTLLAVAGIALIGRAGTPLPRPFGVPSSSSRRHAWRRPRPSSPRRRPCST